MASLKHVHLYERIGPRTLKKRRWRCLDPACTHTASLEEVRGKQSKCTCGEIFVLDTYSLNRVKRPRCLLCRDTKEAKKHQVIGSVLDGIFSGLKEDSNEMGGGE